MKDIIKYNNDTYDIDSGLTLDEVKASLSAVSPGAEDASYSFTVADNGSKIWLVREKPGEKG